MSNFIDSIYVLKNKFESKKGVNASIFFIPNHTKYRGESLANLKKVYKNPGLLEKVTKDDFVIPLAVESFTINELKHIVSNKLNVPAEHILLYCERMSLSKREQNESKNRHITFNETQTMSKILGFSFENEFGKREMDGNFKKSLDFTPNSLDVLVDESNFILSSYSVKDNVIFYYTKEVIEEEFENGRLTDAQKDTLLQNFFPFKNPFKDTDEFAIFKDEKLEILKSLGESLIRNFGETKEDFPLPAEIIDIENMKFSNLVVSTNTNSREDIDIQSIFKDFEFDEHIVFIRYQDQIKNNYFRVNRGILFPNIGKYNVSEINLKLSLKHLLIEKRTVTKEVAKIKQKYPHDMPIQSEDLKIIDKLKRQQQIIESEIETFKTKLGFLSKSGKAEFNNPSNYYVSYTDGKYKPIIDKKTISNWKKPIYLEREEESKERVKGVEQLEMKIGFYQTDTKKYLFFTIVITRFGEIYFKITDLSNSYGINKDEYKEILEISNKILSRLNKKLETGLLSKIDLNETTEIVSYNATNHFILTDGDTFDALRGRITQNSQFGFYIDNTEFTFTYRFLRTNNGYSLLNAKRFFFLLKKSLGQVDLGKLKSIWTSEAARVFKLGKIESLNLLETIGEEVESDDFINSDMDNTIDIIFTQSDDLNSVVVSIINLPSNKDLENVVSFIYQMMVPAKKPIKYSSPKTKSLSQSPPKIIIKTDIKTQNFVNDDNLEIDVDFSDSDSDSDEEEEVEAEALILEKPVDEQTQQKEKSKSPAAAAPAPEKKNEILLREETSRKAISKRLPQNIREYMINMRKDKDPRLFVFKKSSLFDSYSSKCGAVDMRQPILVSKFEVENMMRNEFSRRALEKYRGKLLLWGSSRENLNFYMCPRIWCIRDNCEITPIDFLNYGATCPICGGGVIDPKEKKLSINKTVLLRKGKSNNYWGDAEVPKDFLEDLPIYKKQIIPLLQKFKDLEKDNRISYKEKEVLKKKLKNEISKIEDLKDSTQEKSINEYKKLWKTHLDGTEKLAYPSFLKSKTHPEDLCMPCCNANLKTLEEGVEAIPNYDRCLINRINAYIEIEGATDIQKIKKSLKPGLRVGGMETKEKIPHDTILEINDKVLIINKGNNSMNLLFNVDINGGVIVKKFTNLEIDYQNGVTFEFPEVNKRWISYKNPMTMKQSKSDPYSNDYFKLQSQKKDVQGEYNIQYILGKEKFPLGENKFGVLVDKLDQLLNPETSNRIIKGNIDFERIEATKEMVDKYKSDEIGFIKNVGVPDLEHMFKHKKKNKDVLEVGDLIKKNYKGFLRKGTNQNSKYSIYSVFQNIRTIQNIEVFINVLIETLTPECFISLNCGEVFKAFVPTEFENLKSDNSLRLLTEWIKTYDVFVKHEFPTFVNLTLKDAKKLLSVPNKTQFRLMNLYIIYLSHENYKRFICDLNIEKNYDYVIDLLCEPISPQIYEKFKQHFDRNVTAEQKSRLNPFLIEYNDKNDTISIQNPPFKDLSQMYNFETNKSVLIYKNRDFYENIVLAYKIDKNKMTDYLTIPSKKTGILMRIYNIMYINEMRDEYGYQMPSLSKINELTQSSKKIKIKKYVLDRYFKGVGVLLKSSLGEFLIYTKPFKFNPEVSRECVKFEYKSLPKPTINNLVKFHNLLNEIGLKNIYSLLGLHVDKTDNLLGVYTNSNLLIPLAKEKVENAQKYMGLTVSSKGTLDDIDFLLNTEIDISDIRMMNVSYLEHKASLYNIFKYSLSQIMKKKIKIIEKIKTHLSILFSNYAYPNHLRVERIGELLKPLIDKLFIIFNQKFNNQVGNDEVCIDAKNEGECKLVKGCKYEHGENGICRKLITRENIEILTGYLIHELLYFPQLRDKILDGEFKIKKEVNILDIPELIIDVSFDRHIDDLFIKNDLIYINKNYIDSFIETNTILNDEYLTREFKIPDQVKDYSNSALQPRPHSKNNLVRNENTLAIGKENTTEIFDSSVEKKEFGYAIGWDGKDYSKDPSLKKLVPGECLPSFKMWGDTNKIYNGCSYVDINKMKFPDKLDNKMGKICATSISTSGPRKGSLKTYGICSKEKDITKTNNLQNEDYGKGGKMGSKKNTSVPKPKSLKNSREKGVILDTDGDVVPDVYGDDTDLTGNKLDLTQKKNAKIKPGKCIFPFKYRTSSYPLKTFPRGKIYGKEHPGKDKMMNFYDCVPFTRSVDKYGYKCPTSLKPNKTMDTFALCKTNITEPRVQAELAKKSGANAVDKKPKRKVPFKVKKNSEKIVTKEVSAPAPNHSKKKDVWGVNYVVVNGNKKNVKRDKAIAPGKCVFPFKYKRKDYNECFDVKDNDGSHKMCATKVKPTGSWETLGYCLPEGVTPEEYERILKEEIPKPTQNGGAKDIIAVNYRYDKKGNKKVSKSKKVVPGKCVFPFKHKRKEFNKCAPSEDNEFNYCATKVNSRGTMETYGFCPPEKFQFKKKSEKQPQATHPAQPKKKSMKKRKIALNPTNWISKSFGSGFKINDSIVSNGDCFFDSLQVALENHGVQTTIQELRLIVQRGITHDNFELYKELHQNAILEKDLQMIRETRFISGIDTFEDLKEFVMTNNFWADMLAISIIEKYLRIKVILFDDQRYSRFGARYSVNCGNNSDKFSIVKCSICGVSTNINEKIKNGEIQKEEIIQYLDNHSVKYNAKSNFVELYKEISERNGHNFIEYKQGEDINPTRFVLMNYENGNHYKLVHFKEKTLFKKLSELTPEAFKVIHESCRKMKSYRNFF